MKRKFYKGLFVKDSKVLVHRQQDVELSKKSKLKCCVERFGNTAICSTLSVFSHLFLGVASSNFKSSFRALFLASSSISYFWFFD